MSNLILTRVCDLPVIYWKDFYSKEESKKIIAEIQYLEKYQVFKRSTEFGGPGTAYSNGIPLKEASGVHLDTIYEDRSQSDILEINRKIFKSNLEDYHSVFRYISKSNKDSTKLHIYNEGDHYKDHTDDCVITCISWFYKEPKSFTGGDLILENSLHLPCLNNAMVVFPSILYHQVTPVVGAGRYSMSQFLYI